MKTRFPQYLKEVNYVGSSTDPRNGEYLISVPDFDGFDEVDCILNFRNGKLDGELAIRTTTGYSETWNNGVFVSSRPSFCKP